MLPPHELGLVSESLPALAGVLRAAPESDALVILGRLLDSLPIPVVLTDCQSELRCVYGNAAWRALVPREKFPVEGQDRKSTRLNSSHSQISYAVFCLKKKNTQGVASP